MRPPDRPLPAVVVDFAVHADGLATRNERADGLAARTMERHVDGVVRQAFLAVTLGDLVADHGAERTVHVTDRHLDAHRLLLLKGGLRELDELVVERLVELVVLLDGLVQDGPGTGPGCMSTLLRSMPSDFQRLIASFWSRHSTWPTASSKVRKPSWASSSRTSSAMNMKKLMTCSGLPLKRARSSGSWVAMPCGQVFFWQARIMTQPSTIRPQ